MTMQQRMCSELSDRPHEAALHFMLSAVDETWTVVWDHLSTGSRAAFHSLSPMTITVLAQVRATLIECFGGEEVVRAIAVQGLQVPTHQVPEEREYALTGRPLTVSFLAPASGAALHLPMVWEGTGWRVALTLFLDALSQNR